jgi:hypothetical protein
MSVFISVVWVPKLFIVWDKVVCNINIVRGYYYFRHSHVVMVAQDSRRDCFALYVHHCSVNTMLSIIII